MTLLLRYNNDPGAFRGAAALQAPAGTDLDTGEVLINSRYDWSGIERMVRREHERGKYWSTPGEDHIVLHEIGHYAHRDVVGVDRIKQMNKARLRAADRRTAKLVSDYATRSEAEFVAEAFVGLMEGVEYPPAVMTLYDLLGGVRPRLRANQ